MPSAETRTVSSDFAPPVSLERELGRGVELHKPRVEAMDGDDAR
jgi:hypothetical protein